MTSMSNLRSSYWNAWHHIMTIEWLEWQSSWTVTESHDIIKWPLNDLNDNLYDKLLNHMTYNDQWMTSMTNLMTSYWNAWHHIMTIEWLEWQNIWPVTESHDIIKWPLNALNDNLDDKLLNHMTYNDQWMTSMTNLMTSYWKAWHHIMTIEWLEWQNIWPFTEMQDITKWPLNDFNDNLYDQLLNRLTS